MLSLDRLTPEYWAPVEVAARLQAAALEAADAAAEGFVRPQIYYAEERRLSECQDALLAARLAVASTPADERAALSGWLNAGKLQDARLAIGVLLRPASPRETAPAAEREPSGLARPGAS